MSHLFRYNIRLKHTSLVVSHFNFSALTCVFTRSHGFIAYSLQLTTNSGLLILFQGPRIQRLAALRLYNSRLRNPWSTVRLGTRLVRT